jgi:hypothetical protein
MKSVAQIGLAGLFIFQHFFKAKFELLSIRAEMDKLRQEALWTALPNASRQRQQMSGSGAALPTPRRGVRNHFSCGSRKGEAVIPAPSCRTHAAQYLSKAKGASSSSTPRRVKALHSV